MIITIPLPDISMTAAIFGSFSLFWFFYGIAWLIVIYLWAKWR